MTCVALSPAPTKGHVRVLPLSQEERDEIASMLADGKSAAEIVEWIGCSVAQVRTLMADSKASTCERRKAGAPRSSAARVQRQERERRVLAFLARRSATLQEIRSALHCSQWSADAMMRRLEREGRVRRLSGGRHMPSGQKACLWALPEGEG